MAANHVASNCNSLFALNGRLFWLNWPRTSPSVAQPPIALSPMVEGDADKPASDRQQTTDEHSEDGSHDGQSAGAASAHRPFYRRARSASRSVGQATDGNRDGNDGHQPLLQAHFSNRPGTGNDPGTWPSVTPEKRKVGSSILPLITSQPATPAAVNRARSAGLRGGRAGECDGGG
jgi:hypothetical protein